MIDNQLDIILMKSISIKKYIIIIFNSKYKEPQIYR